MPRFRRALRGPRVTVNPHVMSGPASSGQHVWIGRRARSASFPSHTTCWHGAPETSFGTMCITCLPIGIQRSSTSRNPLGGSGSLRNARSFPTSRSVSRGSAPISPPMARATRCVVPNRLPSTGIAWPLGFSNSRAGPPALSTRSQTSVISSFGSTSARTLLNSPARSSSDRKSRRSRYLISLGDRCRVGTVERDSGPRDSPPNCKVGKNSDKKDRADPVVLVKSLEAGFSVATADEAIVMGHDRGPSGETQIVDETQPAVQADDCEQRERHAVAVHYRKHIVSAEGDPRGKNPGFASAHHSRGERSISRALSVSVIAPVGEVVHHAAGRAHEEGPQREDPHDPPLRLAVTREPQRPQRRPQQQERADRFVEPHQALVQPHSGGESGEIHRERIVARRLQALKKSARPPSQRSRCRSAASGLSRRSPSAVPRAASTRSVSFSRSAKRNRGAPLWRAPRYSPGPRSIRSSRAMTKPSEFSKITRNRLRAASPKGFW